jgi:hypothetical protein
MLDGHPGREFEVNDPGKGEIRTRLYVVNGRLYVLAAQTRGGNPLPAGDAEKFLNSFKLMK